MGYLMKKIRLPTPDKVEEVVLNPTEQNFT